MAVLDETLASSTAPVLLRLRHETRAWHDALERELDLMSEGLTQATYRLRLTQLYGYYRPVELRLLALPGWAERGLDLAQRRKTPLLEADLRDLGVRAPEQLPLCRDVPALLELPQAFGCLYVLEGATLGGRIISRHARRTVGVGPERGVRFFSSHGARVPEMWNAFRAALSAYATTSALEDAVVRGATETFDTLHRWVTKDT